MLPDRPRLRRPFWAATRCREFRAADNGWCARENRMVTTPPGWRFMPVLHAGTLSLAFMYLLALLAGYSGLGLVVAPAFAQSYGADLGFLSLPVETVTVRIANPRSDTAYNDRVTDG